MGLDICHSIPISKHLMNELSDYVTVDELKLAQGYLDRHSDLICTVLEKEGEIINGIYFKDIGYQRKGMDSQFYLDFVNGKLYFEIEDVRKAYLYLKADHINNLSDLKENFKKTFIDNFVEGESIFCASW
jgi:hypothetical protein